MVTTQSGRMVTATRWMFDIDAPPFWRAQVGKEGKVDRWQIIRFEAPCTIVLDVGVGAGEHRRPRGRSLARRQWPGAQHDHAGDRPESRYFRSLVRNYRIHDQSLTTQLWVANARIFTEDQTVVEAQQRALDAAAERRLQIRNIDAGSARARRIIEEMIAQETQGSTPQHRAG